MIKLGIITGDLKLNKTGIGTYTFQLIKNLTDAIDITQIRHPSGDEAPNCSSIVTSLPPGSFSHIMWSQSLSWSIHNPEDFDIIHNPAQYPVSPKIHSNYVITVHDLIPILYPEYVGIIYSVQAKIHYPISMKYATKIITDSNHTKNDIIRLYKIADEKIKVIYPGVSSNFHPASEDEILKVKTKFKLFKPFILFVGAIEPKKNVELLIKAYSLCLKNNPNLELVIAGKKAWKFESVFKLIERLNLKSEIRILDFVPYEDLRALYSGAEVFVFPSRYEGFGLPPLEAMRCGTPVITSNVSSLPEIVGQEGLMVGTDDPEGLADSIIRVISDLNFRDSYTRYCKNRAELFRWEKTAEETLDIYKSVVNGA